MCRWEPQSQCWWGFCLHSSQMTEGRKDGKPMPSEKSDLPSSRPSVVLLGVDAGGSHTAVAIGDARGRLLGRAEGPGSAMRPGGAERSAAVILDVARDAATQAQVSLPAVIALVRPADARAAPEHN